MSIAELLFQMTVPPLVFLYLGFGIRACWKDWKYIKRMKDRY